MSSLAIPRVEVRAEFTEKCAFLAEPHPYKILYGGRDGCKSWAMAQQLVINGYDRPMRWLCTREFQSSIKDSVHALLKDTVARLGLQHHYDCKETEIIGANGTEILFAGLKNAKNIKSYESCDGAWVEEAQTVSKASWEILLPTIRKPGSEIWVSFNPELATDDTYRRWVLKPPPGAEVVKIGHQDNPWLSEISKARIAHLYATDPIAAAHIYGGECKSEVEGAIFRAEFGAARADNRICQVPYNKARPVDTAWDLGFGDLTTIWFLQAYDGWYNFIDYEQGDGLTIADYIIRLQNKGYAYGTHWLPHDSIDTIIHRNLAGSADKSMSIEMLLRRSYPNQVRVAPKLYVADRINAGRLIFGQCRFDADKCADGLQSLSHYAWESAADAERRRDDPRNPSNKPRRREPLHNWASHGADGFQAAAVAIKQPARVEEKPKPKLPPRFGGSYTPFA